MPAKPLSVEQLRQAAESQGRYIDARGHARLLPSFRPPPPSAFTRILDSTGQGAVAAAIAWNMYGYTKFDFMFYYVLSQYVFGSVVFSYQNDLYDAVEANKFYVELKPKWLYLLTTLAYRLMRWLLPRSVGAFMYVYMAVNIRDNITVVSASLFCVLIPSVLSFRGCISLRPCISPLYAIGKLLSAPLMKALAFLLSGNTWTLIYYKSAQLEEWIQQKLILLFSPFVPLLSLIHGMVKLIFRIKPPKPWSYQPLGADRQIRLLRLHRWVPFSGVRVSVIHVTLDDAPPFEALSYHWGTAREKRRITVDEDYFLEVFAPTYDALWSVSSTWRDRIVWIDAVCINQSPEDSNTEKAEQVMMMRDIYQKSSLVIVYLGRSIWAPFASALIHDLLLNRSRQVSSLELYADALREGMSLRWISFINLLNHPWFNRVWIIQEVAMANSIHVWYGGRTYDWDSLADAFRVIDEMEMAGFLQTLQNGRVAVNRLGNIKSMNTMRVRMAVVRAFQVIRRMEALGMALQVSREAEAKKRGQPPPKPRERMADPNPLIQLLETYSEYDATDPRDKVFALLGLMGDTPPPSLTPNYSSTMSTRDVFLRAARHVLTTDQPLSILQIAGVGYGDRLEGLPSWVPDWISSHTPKCGPLASSQWTEHPANYRATLDTGPGLMDMEAIKAAVSTKDASNDTGGNNLNTLTLACVPLGDTIAHLSDVHKVPEDDDLIVFNDPIKGAGLFHAREMLETHRWNVQVVEMARRHCQDPYPYTPSIAINPSPSSSARPGGDADQKQEGAEHKQPLYEAIWRTLSGDTTAPSRPAAPASVFEADYAAWAAFAAEMAPYCLAHCKYSAAYPSSSSGKSSAPPPPPPPPPATVPDTTDPDEIDAFWARCEAGKPFGNSMARCVTGRRVAVTRAGYLGCVPPRARVGDEVVLVLGSGTPFVVRRVGGGAAGNKSDGEEKEEEGDGVGVADSGPVRYQLVGSCYMHGMMDGERLSGGDWKATELVFV